MIVSDSVIQLIRGGRTIGFIETVGSVYVALHGPRYDVAVEIAQHVSFDGAARALHAR